MDGSFQSTGFSGTRMDTSVKNSGATVTEMTVKCATISLPKISLPIKVDIIRHPKELVTVCSSVHACVIAPDDVRMFTFPKIEDYNKEKGVYLVYPSEKAQYLVCALLSCVVS